jgi:hypothetical protein
MGESVIKDDFYNWQTLAVGFTSLCNLQYRMCPAIRAGKSSLTRDQAFPIADFAVRRRFKRICRLQHVLLFLGR